MITMVEPPRLQVQFDAREKIIPILFEKYCKDKYQFVTVPPTREKNPRPGPIKRPTFHIRDDSEEIVAFFNPWGTAACYKEDFRQIYDIIVKEMNQAAKDALQEFEGI